MAVNKQSFAKKFAENGQRTVWEEPQYKLGWDMVGIRPPTKEQFNYLFYNIDEKMAFLLEEIDAGGSVKTTGNQEIAGDKTFAGLTALKKGAIVADSVEDFNANQYLQIGSNNVNSYLHNKKSGKYLSMRNDGELRYDGKRLLNVDDFISQKASSGYMKTPSGLILEWGTAQVPIDSYVQVVFPLAFPTACLNVQATAVLDQAVPGATVLSAHVGRVNQTGCYVGVSENGIVGPRPVYWLAIGY